MTARLVQALIVMLAVAVAGLVAGLAVVWWWLSSARRSPLSSNHTSRLMIRLISYAELALE